MRAHEPGRRSGCPFVSKRIQRISLFWSPPAGRDTNGRGFLCFRRTESPASEQQQGGLSLAPGAAGTHEPQGQWVESLTVRKKGPARNPRGRSRTDGLFYYYFFFFGGFFVSLFSGVKNNTGNGPRIPNPVKIVKNKNIVGPIFFFFFLTTMLFSGRNSSCEAPPSRLGFSAIWHFSRKTELSRCSYEISILRY